MNVRNLLVDMNKLLVTGSSGLIGSEVVDPRLEGGSRFGVNFTILLESQF